MTYNTQIITDEPLTFENKIKNLFKIDDYIYSIYSTYEDPVSGKISREDRDEIIRTSLKIGRELADDILLKDPNKSVRKRINENRIELITEKEKENTKFVYFGTYESKGAITLYEGNILESQSLLKNEEINWISSEDITDIVLAHELFHFYEGENPNMYTNLKEIKLWRLGPYVHKTKLICPSEIAAMAFTKQLLNLNYNPGAINYLLYSSIDKETGNDFYQKISLLNEKELY